MEEEDAEPDDRDLRIEVETARNRQPPEASVAQCGCYRLGLELVRPVATANEHEPDDRAQRGEPRQKEKRSVRAAALCQPGQNDRDDQSSQRDRRLPDPESKPTLARSEPEHHRPPAR